MHVKHISRGLAVLLILITAAYMMHVYPQLPDRVPMQWDGSNAPTWFAGKSEFCGWFAAGMLVMTCLFCFLIPTAATAMVSVLQNLLGLFAFHLVVAQVLPDPLFVIPPDVGTYAILAAGAVGMLVILVVAVASRRKAAPAKEA